MDVRSRMVGGIQRLRDWIGSNVLGEARDYGYGTDPRTRDYAVLGGAAGAAAGGVLGTLGGFAAQGTDSIREEWVPRTVGDPRLDGYSESIIPDIERTCTTEYHTDSDGQTYTTENCTERTRGYWHNYSARVGYDTVGQYTEPRFVHDSWWEPLRAGVLGSLVGGLAGVALGVGIAALRKGVQSDPRLDEARQKDLREFSGSAVLTGAVLGAGVGAVAGSMAGGREIGAQEVHSRTWMAPVMQDKYLGDIPRDHYDWFWPFHDDWSDGRTAVHRQAPVLHADGTAQMQPVEKTFETGRYGPIAGGILGGMIGAGVGLASGVAAGVAAKIVAQGEAAKEAA